MNRAEKYSRPQIVLHWAVAVLLVVSVISDEWMGAAWRAWVRQGDATGSVGSRIHVVVGITILALMTLRLLLRVFIGVPNPPAGENPMLAKAAGAAHWLLYALLVAMPLTGLAAWFGDVRTAAELHEVLFNLTLLVVGLHTAAALFHQYVLKDGLLLRMR